MPLSFVEQQLGAMQVISVIVGVILLTIGFFVLHNPLTPPYLPIVLSGLGIGLFVISALIALIRSLMHR